jgi:flagellar basal-body rod modification protein FlgD
MQVQSIAPLLPASATRQDHSAEKPKSVAAEADFNSFLVLLTAQLRHQDPLQPLDATQFVAQLASFSTVEQLVGVNTRLDAQADRAAAEATASYAGWIGRAASATDGRFLASGETEVFTVPRIPGTDRIEAVVRTADGREVDRFQAVTDANGQAVWTGAAAHGIVSGAELKIELVYRALDTVIERRPAPVFRTITGLRGTPDGPTFDLAGGGTLPPGDIAELRESTRSAGTDSAGRI